MKIKFGTALFGEKTKAHSLIQTSDRKFGEALVPYTDLPIDLPNAVGDTPMLSGFRLQDKFVFLRVLRDRNASRGGMATTQAVFTELNQVGRIENLLTIFDAISLGREQFNAGSEIEIDVTVGLKNPTPFGSFELFRALTSEANSPPVVWVGQDGFCEAIAGLWHSLTTELRPSLTFRFASRPTDSLAHQRSVVVVPYQSAGQWSKYHCLAPPFGSRELEETEKTFFDPDSRRSVFSFASELDFSLDQLDKFAIVAKCFSILGQLKTETDQNISILIRHLAGLSPAPESATIIKESVISELATRTIQGPVSTFKYLRNLKTDAFKNGFLTISNACTKRYLELLKVDAPEAWSCSQLALKNMDYAWSHGLLNALGSELANGSQNAVETYLKLLFDDDFNGERWVNDTADLIPGLESELLNQISDALPKNVVIQLMKFCVLHEWDRLHARLAVSVLTPSEAVASQIAFPKSSGQGIAELSRGMGSDQFAAEAAKTGIPAYWAQVGADCQATPSLFEKFDVSHLGWRSAFRDCVDTNTNLPIGLTQLDRQIKLGWEMLIDCQLDDPDFFDAVSKTRFASILHLENRSKIWGKLSSTSERRVLTATAIDWIDHLAEEISSASALEDPLRKELLAINNRETILRVGSEYPIQTALSVFKSFGELRESDFERYRVRLFTERSQLSTIDARMIGSFVAKRRWRNAAESILADYRKYRRADLKPALEQCVSMFSWITKWMNGIQERPISEPEWWDEVVQVLCDIYPTGPQHNHIWKRAGGSLADLSDSGSGKVRWNEAIRLLHNGLDASGLTIDKLFGRIQADYANNPAIEMLISHCPFDLSPSRNDFFVD